MARETYSAFAARMVAQAQSEHDVRVDLEAEILRLANSYRISQGQPMLKPDLENVNAARAHAMDMMLHHFMGHVASTGHDFESRMRALRPDVMVLPRMAENAVGQNHAGEATAAVAAKLFQLWIKSPAHREALVSLDYVHAATGVVAKNGAVYIDMIFVGPQITTNMNMNSAVPAATKGLY